MNSRYWRLWKDFASEAAFGLFVLGTMCLIMNYAYSGRCASIGGEWSALRGCKVVNVYGKTQWVTRP